MRVAARYNAAANAPTPAASPSMLSRKFMALVTTTIQTTLSVTASTDPAVPQPSSSESTRMPPSVASTLATPS